MRGCRVHLLINVTGAPTDIILTQFEVNKYYQFLSYLAKSLSEGHSSSSPSSDWTSATATNCVHSLKIPQLDKGSPVLRDHRSSSV